MSWHSLPVIIMVGIAGYAAVLFCGLYLALARHAEAHERREYLTFALTCVAVGAYDISCVGLYNAESLEQGIFWMRGNMLTASGIGITYQAFVWDFIGARMPKLLRAAAWALAALGLTVAVWDSPYTFTTAFPAIKELRFLGREITYYEAEPGIIDQVLMALFLVIYATNITYLVRYFISAGGRRQPGQLGFLCATVVACLAATNDFLTTAQLYTFPYTFEYGFGAILTAVGYVLMMRFGELHAVVKGLNRDLTRTNRDLVVALEQANESVRAKTEFLATMSHELRTPLNAIINLPQGLHANFESVRGVTCTSCHAEFELDPGESWHVGLSCAACGAAPLTEQCHNRFVGDAEEARRCLVTVARAGKHLLALVSDVLDASKLDLGRTVLAPTPFDPVELIIEVIDSAQTIADEKEISLHFQNAAGTGALLIADRVKLQQVLWNLLGNAIKFSPRRAGIVASLSRPTREEYLICIRDQGIGIAREHHASIFSKFTQVDTGGTRNYGGTGLGLAISKGIVELHGGHIWVESEPGAGATFFVRLPAPAEVVTSGAVTAAPAGMI